MTRLMSALAALLWAGLWVSDKGGKYGFVYKSRQHVYKKLVGKYGKEGAARIANAGVTKAKRSAMAKKAARTRKIKR